MLAHYTTITISVYSVLFYSSCTVIAHNEVASYVAMQFLGHKLKH